MAQEAGALPLPPQEHPSQAEYASNPFPQAAQPSMKTIPSPNGGEKKAGDKPSEGGGGESKGTSLKATEVEAGGAGGEKGAGGGAAVSGKAKTATATKTNRDRYQWMPSLERSSPSRMCIRRVRNDVRSMMRDPVPGLFACLDEDLVTVVHTLITGPFDTPYEGGFFYFVMHCPDDYPHSPPRVRLMTTGGGSVRFNPNLYMNGKVCLSILGTWNGPRWTPAQSISSVLLSIQSLMNEKPYHNEPGFEVASNPQDVRDYSDCITHETLRVAVCAMVDDSSLWRSMPECFRSLTRGLFLSFVPRYELVCEQHMHRDGQMMADPFGQNKGAFRYRAIERSIQQIVSMVGGATGGEEGDDSSRACADGAEPMESSIGAAATAEEGGAESATCPSLREKMGIPPTRQTGECSKGGDGGGCR